MDTTSQHVRGEDGEHADTMTGMRRLDGEYEKPEIMPRGQTQLDYLTLCLITGRRREAGPGEFG